MCARVVLKLHEAKGTIIFPLVNDALRIAGKPWLEWLKAEEYAIPNRASGYIENLSIDDTANIFQEIEKVEIEGNWCEFQQQARQWLKHKPFSNFNAKHTSELVHYYNKVPCPIQLVWVAADLKSDAEPMKKIEELYIAVKRTRPIEVPSRGAEIDKCPQCGKREAIGPSVWQDFRAFRSRIAQETHAQRGLRINTFELLCVVCLTKRLLGYGDGHLEGIPSTNEIAAREWVSKLRTKLPAFDNYKGFLSLHKEDFEEDIEKYFYPRALDKLKDLNAAHSTEQRAVYQSALNLHDKLTSEIRQDRNLHLKEQPSNYLAVMTFDGDSMGKFVQQYPKSITNALARFSKRLKNIFKGHEAKAFYIGGDEGLVLCPIEYVFDLALAIRTDFTSVMEAEAELHQKPTLSMGICLFDRERPLGAAIASAHHALNLAKSRKNEQGTTVKDALTVVVQTTSGNEFAVMDGWGPQWERLHAAVILIRDEKLSAAWAYDCERAIREIGMDSEMWRDQQFRGAVREELKRITLRRWIKKDTKEKFTGIWDDLHGDSWLSVTPAEGSLELLANGLHLVGFLVRESCLEFSELLKEETK